MLILVTGCSAGSSATGPTPIPPGPDLEQSTYTVQRGTVPRSLEFTGRVGPYTKLKVSSRSKAIVWARERGLDGQ